MSIKNTNPFRVQPCALHVNVDEKLKQLSYSYFLLQNHLEGYRFFHEKPSHPIFSVYDNEYKQLWTDFNETYKQLEYTLSKLIHNCLIKRIHVKLFYHTYITYEYKNMLKTFITRMVDDIYSSFNIDVVSRELFKSPREGGTGAPAKKRTAKMKKRKAKTSRSAY
jgi:hypothetical protein